MVGGDECDIIEGGIQTYPYAGRCECLCVYVGVCRCIHVYDCGLTMDMQMHMFAFVSI